MELWLDCGEEIIPRGSFIEEDPLTAIARAYTKDGFAVAADSRKWDHFTNSFTDTSQKIFRLKHKSASVICSIAGLAQWTNFDLASEIIKCSQRIAEIALCDLDDYASKISAELLIGIEKIGCPKNNQGKNAKAETWVYLDGYALDAPIRHKIKVIHGNGVPTMEISPQELSEFLCHGSQVVYNGLTSVTPLGSFLSSYRNAFYALNGDSLEDSIARSEIFIKAHSDPEALVLDKDGCEGIGGPVHIVTLTPDKNFKWAPGFKPAGHIGAE